MSTSAGAKQDDVEHAACGALVSGRYSDLLALSAIELRNSLTGANLRLVERFRQGDPVDALVTARAGIVDTALKALWHKAAGSKAGSVGLVAVGGYGRGELHPHSDIDVMVLLPDSEAPGDWLSEFLTWLWDIGLDVGHSVRTVADCVREARQDLTIVTTLMESRLLEGPAGLFESMTRAVGPAEMWNSRAFFEAKRKEQIARHHRYGDTGYNLEPNVKGSPGGLRDIQLIGWVAKRHFGVSSFAGLVEHKFLTEGQLQLLTEGRSFLWLVRFVLHAITDRAEDRLLFDHQIKLAEMLGYEDASYTLAVEQLMQRYYRTVMDLSRLNEMLLQLFEEAILLDPHAQAEPLNERFKVRNGFLQTTGDEVFQRNPSALLEVFVLLQQHQHLRGVSAWTVGLIKRNLHLIDDEFRLSPKNHRMFLKILSAPEGVTHELRRMNLYGVLGLYIPQFGRIVGRMQYDLFHAYTVDEHTLFVVSNLRRFALTRYDDEFPVCSGVMQRLDKPELAYLGGLFHDIAKGRGGDHSTLGAVEAESFCLEHGLETDDAKLVAWLVLNHLILSTTAQKKDISDPAVIKEFAKLVGDQHRLDYLYVLTVADVRGTNPKLWNSWKASLFQELYARTKQLLSRGLDNSPDSAELIRDNRNNARAELVDSGVAEDALERIWKRLPDEYFLRYRADEIAWHTAELANNDTAESPLLAVRAVEDGVAVFLYTPQRYHTFAHTTGILGELGLNILDARIVPDRHNYSLDTYIVHEYGTPLGDTEQRLTDIRRRLAPVIEHSTMRDDDWQPRINRQMPRQARMFSTPTEIRFHDDEGGHTVMELTTADRPGLLFDVGRAFLDLDIDITTAKILTIGERAEDVFYITDVDKQPLSTERRAQLHSALTGRLNEDKNP